jgi:DNA-binding transcriptional MocR family regulator
LPEHFEGHVAELRDVYRRRRDLTLTALAKYMPEGVNWSVPTGGFFIWMTVPGDLDTRAMLAQAREMGIEYLPGSACFFDGSGRNQIRLSFSFGRDEEIDEGISRLADLVKSELAESISG